MLRALSLLLLSALQLYGLGMPAQAAEGVQCSSFAHCVQKTLSSTTSIDKILYATEALKRWDKSLPQRDLINVLKLRADALLEFQLSGQAPSNLDLLSQADADYRRILALEPHNWLPLAGLGRVAELQDKLPAARDFYARAVKADKTPAYVQRALFFERQQDWNKALQDLNQALRREQELQRHKLGLPPRALAELYLQRAEIHAQLKHALDEMLDREEACKLGLKKACTH